MQATIDLIISFLQRNEIWAYVIIFPLSIIEGPILTVICGFMIAQQILNPILVYIIVIAGDIVGDSFNYVIGRFGGERILSRYGHVIGLTRDKLEFAQQYFESRRIRSLALSKLIHGIGMVGLVIAGTLRVPYGKFFFGCLIISLGQSLALMVLGIFSGQAFQQVEAYLNFYVAAGSGILIGVVGVWGFHRLLAKIPNLGMNKY